MHGNTLRDYKKANQERKLAIRLMTKIAPKGERAWWANIGLVQDGKHTKDVIEQSLS